MQHLGTEDEMQQAWRDLLATLSPEERLEGLSPEVRLEGLSSEVRLEGLSPKERLKGLSPEEMLRELTAAERERLRLLLQQPPPGEAESASGK